jgi:hypothetical protein
MKNPKSAIRRTKAIRNPKSGSVPRSPVPIGSSPFAFGHACSLLLALLLAVVSRAPGQQCPNAELPSDYCASPRVIPGTPGRYEVRMDVSTATGVETH